MRSFPDEYVDSLLDAPFQFERRYNVLFQVGDGAGADDLEAFDDTLTLGPSVEERAARIAAGPNRPAAGEMEAMRTGIGENPLMAICNEGVRLSSCTGCEDSGSYLHSAIQPRAHPPVSVDVVFGPENFRNEILWRRIIVRRVVAV